MAFVNPSTQLVRDARFYVNEMPDGNAFYQVAQFGLYPTGTEDETGPIREILIPTNSVGVTGAGISLITASTYPDALYQPGDSRYAQIAYTGSGTPTAIAQYLGCFFAVNQYPELQGKRILNVSMLYRGSIQDVANGSGVAIDFVNPIPDQFSLTLLAQVNDIGAGIGFTSPSSVSQTGALTLNPFVGNSGFSLQDAQIHALDIGDVNNCWDPTALNGSEKLPWRYADLQRFEASAANRQMLKLQVNIPVTTGGASGAGTSVRVFIDYIALRVLYCEEKRVAYGGQQFGYSYGMNKITARSLAQAADPAIASGVYTPTLSFVSMGQIGFGAGLVGAFPKLNGVRQLYEIPSHPAVDVNIPFPLVEHLGDAFTATQSMVLPQVSVHASGGPLTQPHVYGRQAAARVYGTVTATQDVYDDITGVNASYPQVRYYARRFGETNVPLTLTGTGVFTASTTSITVDDFDALAEIVDGWKEVTLRFGTAPSLGAATGTPGWTWSAPNETLGNHWEILAASAPAISGVPGSLYTLVPSPNQLGTATYQPSLGDTVELTWLPQGVASPWVTGVSTDAATDAVLIFSQDPQTITGVAVVAASQTVTGFGLNCGTLPCCIPTGIAYNSVTWSQAGSTILTEDSFNRTVVSGVGSPDVGSGSYAITDIAGAYNVNGDELLITPSAAGTPAVATVNVGSPDFDIIAEIGVSGVMVAGTSARANLVGRFTDANNQMTGLIQQTQSSGATVVGIQKTVAGVETVLAAYSSPLIIDGGARVWARFMGAGTTFKYKAWNGALDDQPALWQVEQIDSSLTTGNRAGVSGRSGTLVGNTLAFESLRITSPSYWFGGYELQRFDTTPGAAFETIMLASDISTVAFRDYEARVGINSVYRIRSLNALNFAGSWSAQVTGAPPTPGVTGGCSDSTGALIFTSNADQTGASNCAYVMQWERDPLEDFALPEADMVQYQPMFGRDGAVAFHGTERGLESFNRDVLLQAAAIDPIRLADAKTIRDLAWAQLPYVCVRDEIGDRWFASVRVPAVNARLNRTRYMARINIVQTTLTPFPVDP